MQYKSALEKRSFTRVTLEADVQLISHKGKWHCNLIDLSLAGLLIKIPNDLQVEVGERFLMEVVPSDSDIRIRMHGKVAHNKLGRVGFQAHHMGQKSIKYLSELVRERIDGDDTVDQELSVLFGT